MEPVIKAFKIASNCNEILEAMTQKLSKEQQHYCTPIEGSETRGSQAYPPGMVHTILKTLQTVSQRRDPQRFGPIYTTWATMPVQDLRSWDLVVTRVDQETSRTSLRPYNIPLESEFGKQIAELTRWNLARIQVAPVPTSRRMPSEFAYTHRGALIIYSSGEKELEFEDIAPVRFPKQRFSKPVRLAMFFYGTPTEEDLKPEAIEEQHHGLPLPGLPTDITFPTLEKPVPLEVKRSVARLHLNLGHSAQEMSRMLAYHGTAPLEVIAAVKALECATCKRLQAPQKPRPSTAPRLHIGQFGDELQIDNFYLRTLDSKNHPIMGICDRTTNLHQAVRLQSREPQETLDALVTGWIRPYGLPATVRCDPDGAYMGVFKDWLQERGVEVDCCPPEAHWQIGQVERRNAILRIILEKIVDELAILDDHTLDQAIACGVYAMNSSTYTRGRTPYQAVFGRLPQMTGILESPTGIINKQEHEDSIIKADLLRSEAIKCIAELNVNQPLRRALLRKTKRTGITDLTPGDRCAFWRWRKVGTKKRGAWTTARFLSWDSPGKTAWVRSGHTTILVTSEQLRAAVGFEQWTPSEEDIRCLKDASKSLKDTVFEDERGDGPDDLSNRG